MAGERCAPSYASASRAVGLLGHGLRREMGKHMFNGTEAAMTVTNADAKTKADVRSRDIGIVLAGVDFSDLSIEALGAGQGLAAKAAGELHLVHVLPLPTADGLVATRATRELRYAELAGEMQVKLQGLVANVTRPIRRVSLHVRVGKPDLEIAQLAADIAADLIVVGAHGSSGITRLVLGSVSQSLVAHAPCPVLAYRSKSGQPWPDIEPPCADCLAMQRETGRQRLWCDRHQAHHPRAHTYSEVPETFGMGSQTFR
jgi:nucleotide-binding universal stress UspA family protein